ncbi:hypothetical protein BCV69DRAFT_297873 [Microstroma glucosiphilum]|uniref:Mediator of RNA polymerase II transcription subunit 21 n=1 Tax=Pseudomicrostroma glucosiphilum TaxID=1684307 RepID=A0A316UCN2_9BASI|nr:hypothetical protein BCV69DRAFT_297873 [Pseudomicrostroma glucosiphilum]PWN22594.1 hypothetical protein BCV69DRAFT_297873 [Pseudomicrostroma glucosiphilum]
MATTAAATGSTPDRSGTSVTTATAEASPLTSLDERSDSLSTLSSSLSVVLQIASTALYRLSSTQHIQINPDIPTHTHLHAGGTAQGADGLIAPAQIREDVKEMTEDLMERVKWMKDEIGRLEAERKEAEHEEALIALDKELVVVNAEYVEALAEAEELQKEIDALLLQCCS